MKREEIIAKVESIAERAATAAGVEIFQVELKGGGKHQMLRIVIDSLSGVTHAECEAISRMASELLDAEDPIPGTYQLEVSSPGVERPLLKWGDWERFKGQKAKVVFKEPVPVATAKTGELKHVEGLISAALVSPEGERSIKVEIQGGVEVAFPFEQVSHANLMFEW